METFKKLLESQSNLVWFVCEKGTVTGIQDGALVTLTKGMMCRSLPFSIFRILCYSTDAKVTYSSIDTESELFRIFLFHLFPQTHRMQFFQNIVLRLSDQQIEFFKKKVEQITSLEREAANPDTPLVLKENLMYSSTLKKMDLIMDFDIDHVRSNGQNYSNKINKSFFKMFVDFIELVEMHCCVNHFVDFYAQQLNVSARRLLECIKNFSGKTPSQWINDILISKIKVDLLLNQKTVCQMVDDYGFSDTSALYKYFRNATGMSPKQFQITNMIEENKE